MLAVNQPKRVYITEPRGNREQRQIARMVRHLRDQYLERNPNVAMPSDWLLEQLVINGAKRTVLSKDGWQLRVTLTLKEIILDCSYPDCLYINNHNNLPLFPNSELFEPWEIHEAMKRLLAYLNDEQI